MKLACSVTILTRNNEATLAQCLASVSFCDDIIVLDGNSTDRTVEIAKQFGARVYPQYDTAEQNIAIKNFTELRKKSFELAQHNWVFYIDSDEYCDEILQKEIRRVVETDDAKVVGFFNRHPIVEGEEIKHAYFLPDWCSRLINTKSGVHWKEAAVVHEAFVYPEGIKKIFLKGSLFSYWPDFEATQKKDRYYLGLSEEKFVREIATRNAWLFVHGAFKNTARAVVIFLKILCTEMKKIFRIGRTSGATLPFRFHMRFVYYHLHMAWSRKKWRALISHTWRTTPRAMKIILVGAMLVRLGLFFLLLALHGQNAFVYGPNGDAVGYVTIAHNLLAHHAFSDAVTAPFTPNDYRTPGYPLILILLGAGNGIFWLTALVQIIASIVLITLVFRYARSWMGERVALIAAALTAFEPNMVYYPTQLISETFFAFTFFIAFLFATKFLRDLSTRNLSYALLFFALATYIRPVTGPLWYVLPLVVPVIVCALAETRRIRKAFIALCVTLAFLAGAILPWSVRNYVAFHRFDFVSVFASRGSVGKYLNAYTAYRFNKTPSELYPDLIARPGYTLEPSRLTIHYTLETFMHDPVTYGKIIVLNAIPWFVGNGWYTIAKTIAPHYSIPVDVFSWNGNPSTLITFIRHASSRRAIIFVVANVLYGILGFAFFAGLVRAFFASHNATHREWLLILLIILYFIAVSGVESYARFRYPAEPFLFLFTSALFL